MATRKRRSTRRRRVTRARAHNPVNPTRRRRVSSHRRRHLRTLGGYRRRNPMNLTRRRRRVGRRHHRRNPLRAAGGEIVSYAGAGIGLGLFQPIVQQFVGPYASALGQFGGPALTALSGWGLSKIFEMFSFTRRFAHPALVLGFSTAVIQVVQPIVARTLAGVGAAPAQTGMGWRRGMNGIAAVTGIPPQIAPPPPMPQQQGMRGMATVPGVWNR